MKIQSGKELAYEMLEGFEKAEKPVKDGLSLKEQEQLEALLKKACLCMEKEERY